MMRLSSGPMDGITVGNVKAIQYVFSQKEVVKSIGNPAGIWQGTGLGLRERDRDGIGLGLSRLRATPFTFATISQRRMHESKSQAT